MSVSVFAFAVKSIFVLEDNAARIRLICSLFAMMPKFSADSITASHRFTRPIPVPENQFLIDENKLSSKENQYKGLWVSA